MNRLTVLLACLYLLFSGLTAWSETGTEAKALLAKSYAAEERDPAAAIRWAQASLKTAISSRDEFSRLEALNQLSGLCRTQHSHSAAENYATNLYLAAVHDHIDTLAGDAQILLGLNAYDQDNFRAAIGHYQAALPYYTGRNAQNHLAVAYLNIGICRKKLAEFELANYYFFKSAAIFNRLNQQDNLANTYNSIGLCFSALKSYPQAVYYLRQALRQREAAENKPMIASSYNNLGFVFKESAQPDSALHYLLRCLQLRKNSPDSSIFVLTLQNIGSAYLQQHKPVAALAFIHRSLGIAHAYQMTEETGRGTADLAEVFLVQRNYPAAMAAIRETGAVAGRLLLPDLTLQYDDLSARAMAAQGDYKQAMRYTLLKERLSDSLFTDSKSKSIAELQIKYETSRKEHDLATLRLSNSLEKKINRQQQWLIILLVTAAGTLFTFFMLAYRNYRVKKKGEEKIRTLMRDLHHRVKNNLQILSGLFTLQISYLQDEDLIETLREHESRLNSMNMIHQKLYREDSGMQIEMPDYLGQLVGHLQTAFGVRKPGSVICHLEIADVRLDADIAVAVGLIVNELVTNAFKYAFPKNKGELLVSLQQPNRNELLLVVRDNGRTAAGSRKAGENGFGLKLVKLMVVQLNAQLTELQLNGRSYEVIIPC